MSRTARPLGRIDFLRPRPRHLLVGLPPLLIVVIVALASRQPPVPQPVAFNHRKHAGDLKLGCEFCHQFVTVGAHAGLPDARICRICHQVQQGKTAEAARLTELLTQGAPLRFNKLFRLATHVRYTHRRHVGIAKLDCRQCHGDIADSDRPPSRALVRITMNFCLDCHRANGQSLDCVACHR